jgi:NitT/TauT family transport system substrate-binding protein
MRAVSRRELLAGLSASALLAACASGRRDVVRIGFMTNVTHAPVIAGIASGRLAQALGVRIEARSFRSGPRVLEALLGDAIDVGSAGPSAVVYTNARHAPGTLRLLGGVCSGGASFVVRRDAGIRGPGDLSGRTLATVGLGTTQDISLRKYLRAHGYAPAESGGDVTVHALDASTILSEMTRGSLDGAWLPEPWATRIVREASAARLVDERDLWPDHRFPTAVLVARGDWARAQPGLATRVATGTAIEVVRAAGEPDETRGVVGDELARLLGKRLPADLLAEAWRWVDFTSDPLMTALDTIAGDAFTLGLAPRSSSTTLLG